MDIRTEHTPQFDRHARIGDFAVRVSQFFKRFWIPLLLLLGGETALLYYQEDRAASCFALISLGTVVILGVWRNAGVGLPLVPLIAIQHLFVYGLPIVTANESIRQYGPEHLLIAGQEVLLFSVCLAAAWALALYMFPTGSARSFSLSGLQVGGAGKLRQIGLGLIVSGTTYQLLAQAHLLDGLFSYLPNGTRSMVLPLVTGANACGFFLVSMFVGSRSIAGPQVAFFWCLLVVSTGISASSFLLSAASTMVAAVFIGLFWSSGRIPWFYLLITVSVFSFLSVGKFEMRGKYWQFGDDREVPTFTFSEIPEIYVEWTEASIFALTVVPEAPSGFGTKKKSADNPQTIFDRINNLQNLLYVAEAMESQKIPPLDGATYSLIPPLLVPRILWPDKPRSHEGQVMLNVHFGRQDLGSTYKTYVAWGLLAEAYGNFGRYYGAVILGVALGVLFAWLECITARKMLISLEGFVAFVVLLGFAGSFEMVASVLVTMVFQSTIPIVLACIPFVHETEGVPREGAPP